MHGHNDANLILVLSQVSRIPLYNYNFISADNVLSLLHIEYTACNVNSFIFSSYAFFFLT